MFYIQILIFYFCALSLSYSFDCKLIFQLALSRCNKMFVCQMKLINICKMVLIKLQFLREEFN